MTIRKSCNAYAKERKYFRYASISLDIPLWALYTRIMSKTTTSTLPYTLDIYDTRVVSWGDTSKLFGGSTNSNTAHLYREWAASREDAESSRERWLNTRAGRAGQYNIKITRVAA